MLWEGRDGMRDGMRDARGEGGPPAELLRSALDAHLRLELFESVGLLSSSVRSRSPGTRSDVGEDGVLGVLRASPQQHDLHSSISQSVSQSISQSCS